MKTMDKRIERISIVRSIDSEYMTGNITGHYVSYQDKYYMANRRTSTAYADIAKEIKAIN